MIIEVHGHVSAPVQLYAYKVTDPHMGRSMDDTAHWIQEFDWLSDKDKKLIFEDNARKIYRLDKLFGR